MLKAEFLKKEGMSVKNLIMWTMKFKFPNSYKANRPKPFQWLGKIIIKASGWKIKGHISDVYENKKFVAIVAPHTSNWDAVVGLAAIAAIDLKVYFIGKHTVFKLSLIHI